MTIKQTAKILLNIEVIKMKKQKQAKKQEYLMRHYATKFKEM